MNRVNIKINPTFGAWYYGKRQDCNEEVCGKFVYLMCDIAWLESPGGWCYYFCKKDTLVRKPKKLYTLY